MAEEKWYYLDTHFIDQSYTLCRKPIDSKSEEWPKMSNKKLEELYEKIDKIKNSD